MENLEIREFGQSDYDEAIDLWQETENLCPGHMSQKEVLFRYLARNPEASSIARVNGALKGTILAGHDGYRGHIKSLAVSMEYRGMGLSLKLVERSMEILKREGIYIVYLSVSENNKDIIEYWSGFGFRKY